MKRFVFVLVAIVLFMTGCALMADTPSNAVKEYLNRYRDNDTVVVNELNEYLDTEDMDDDTKEEYRKVYLRQYSNLKYDIKDETINGDEATVEVKITVFDYYKTNTLSGDYYTANSQDFLDENGDLDLTKYVSYKIDKLVETTDTVDYTLTINLAKVDGSWEVQPLSLDDLYKLHGTYEY